ncbi:MAG: hypothetical protein F4X64_14790 [Chloroflexi bacterium]|nr:hypothetical protein [Chloroflexota bacterium]
MTSDGAAGADAAEAGTAVGAASCAAGAEVAAGAAGAAGSAGLDPAHPMTRARARASNVQSMTLRPGNVPRFSISPSLPDWAFPVFTVIRCNRP